MTREEAINVLKEIIDESWIFSDIEKAPTIDACNMAIKALEQEPCEDCISREWIKTAIHNFYNGLIHAPTEEDIQAYLDVAPSVQPKTDTWSIKEVADALEKHGLLEQEPCEDCISRAGLYNRIKKIDHDEDYECDEFGGSRITYHTCDWDEVLREIKNAPSITPQEPKTDVLDKIRAEIARKANSGQWSEATIYGMQKSIAIIDKYRQER